MNILHFINSLFREELHYDDDSIVGKNIYSLANDILSQAELDLIDKLTSDFNAGGFRKKQTIKYLQEAIGDRPKRPVYYITAQYLPHLPHYTRDVMRYLGDYIDMLIKYLASDILSNKKYLKNSMGINLHHLKGKLDNTLIDSLLSYNEIIYVPAKHDFEVKKRSHRFNYREVIIACILTAKFANEIKDLSPLVRQYALDQLPL